MTKRKHFLNKLNSEQRSHYMKYIRSKNGMKLNVAIRYINADGKDCGMRCLECRDIAYLLDWNDLIKDEEKKLGIVKE